MENTKRIPREDGSGEVVVSVAEPDLVTISSIGPYRTTIIGLSVPEATEVCDWLTKRVAEFTHRRVK